MDGHKHVNLCKFNAKKMSEKKSSEKRFSSLVSDFINLIGIISVKMGVKNLQAL